MTNEEKLEIYAYFCDIRGYRLTLTSTAGFTALCKDVECKDCKYLNTNTDICKLQVPGAGSNTLGTLNTQLKLIRPEYFM